jgi:flagellar biogenesis protein FliO
MSILDTIGSLKLPLALVAGVTYLSVRLWSKKQKGKALKALLIIVTVLVGLSILLLLDILIGYLFPIR